MSKRQAPFYDKIEQYIIIFLFSAMLLVTAFTVCSRYMFSFTFSWAEQVTRIMFVWITFAGISWAGKLGVHMRVSAITSFTGEKIGRYVFLFGDAVTVFFGFFMAWKIFGVMQVVIRKGQIFATVPWIPVWAMYLAGVLGMLGLSLRVIQSRLQEYRNGQKEDDTGEDASC